MEYYISRDQQTYGPYSETEIRAHLESGALVPSDHAWREGETEWRPLGELTGFDAGAIAIPPVPAPAATEPTKSHKPSAQEPDRTVPGSGSGEKPVGFRAVRLLTVALAVLLLGYLASPYLCLILLNRALGSGNVTMVERLVDFPALRQEFHKEASRVKEHPDLAVRHAPYLGVAPEAIPSAADYLGRRYLTPSGLPSLLSRPELALREQSGGTFASMSAQTIDPSRMHWAFFTGLTEFVADLDGLKLTFRVSGGFWRLERISFL